MNKQDTYELLAHINDMKSQPNKGPTCFRQKSNSDVFLCLVYFINHFRMHYRGYKLLWKALENFTKITKFLEGIPELLEKL